MVLVDDILMFPVHSVLWIFREIHDAAQEELANEADSITAELSYLYMKLETGRISEAEFAAEEKTLLDRLETLEDQDSGEEAEDGGEELQPPSIKKRVA
ncbi:MAG TPA: gas vesicle protein GvpG [Terriglobia bacterium]|nr:gas vesicle protein GvpG [Terriglobia bacterium]